MALAAESGPAANDPIADIAQNPFFRGHPPLRALCAEALFSRMFRSIFLAQAGRAAFCEPNFSTADVEMGAERRSCVHKSEHLAPGN
jgi:hypothetical protein